METKYHIFCMQQWLCSCSLFYFSLFAPLLNGGIFYLSPCIENFHKLLILLTCELGAISRTLTGKLKMDLENATNTSGQKGAWYGCVFSMASCVLMSSQRDSLQDQVNIHKLVKQKIRSLINALPVAEENNPDEARLRKR